MTDETAAERPAGEPSQEFGEWAWPRKPRFGLPRRRNQDRQMLWTTIVGTFIGGVVSIVVGAAVLAIAVALGRWAERAHGPRLAGLTLTTAAFAGGFVVALLLFAAVGVSARRYGDSNRVMAWLALVLGVVSGFALALALLAWLGIAAGVK